MRKFICLPLALFALAGCASDNQLTTSSPPATSTRPLFDAFITFCVNTGADPTAVKAAVLAAGGRQWSENPIERQIIFDVIGGGRHLKIGTGIQSLAGTPTLISTHCIAQGEGADEASVAAIKNWVGVPGGPLDGSSYILEYDYVSRNGKRELSDKQNVSQDGYWHLRVYDPSGFPAFHLNHFVPESKLDSSAPFPAGANN